MKTDVSISLGPSASTLDEFFAYIDMFGARGVSFSGGDPVLCLDRVLSFARILRERYGGRLYLWLYTNGNLLSDGIVRLLKRGGIDEIRLNLAARGYDPAPLEIVRKHYSRTTVEIPAVPRQEKKLMALVDTLEDMGCTHLNIHELCPPLPATERKRAGAVTIVEGSDPWYSRTAYSLEEGSEELCLEVLERALRRKYEMSVHYCSNRYRAIWQKEFILRRTADYFVGAHHRIEKPGFLESLAVWSPKEELTPLIPREEIFFNEPFGVCETHPKHLEKIKALHLPVARLVREPVFHRYVEARRL
jgi:pyruvate formate-lyase activating enzyme-like uncharacterized protein